MPQVPNSTLHSHGHLDAHSVTGFWKWDTVKFRCLPATEDDVTKMEESVKVSAVSSRKREMKAVAKSVIKDLLNEAEEPGPIVLEKGGVVWEKRVI